MWDRPAALRSLANTLFTLAAAGLAAIAVLLVIHLPVFPVREVLVVGDVSHVTRNQIEAVVRGELRGNFFTIELESSRAAFEKLPWVRRVNVRRQWPGRLEVTFEEHAALGRWGEDGLVNTYGELFMAASDEALPLLSGPPDSTHEVTDHFLGFRQALEPTGRGVAEVALSARRAWRVRLDDGTTLELGRELVAPRLARFVANWGAFAAVPRHAATVVDLRYPNGFAVRGRDARAANDNKV